MRKTRTSIALALVASMASSGVMAADCAPEVMAAQNSARQSYVEGVSGLAQNNFSGRPGTFSLMSCLDKFMQGNMDVFFKPPALNDLLQQALSFACQQAGEAAGLTPTASGSLNILGSLSGGLSVPSPGGGSTVVNLATVFGQGSSSTSGSSGSVSTLFNMRR